MKKFFRLLIILLLAANAVMLVFTYQSTDKRKKAEEAFFAQNTEYEQLNETLKSETNKLEALSRSSTEKNTPSDEKFEKNLESTGVSVCIDPGHGITSQSGKEPVSPGSGETKAAHVSGTAGEEEFNLSVALKLRSILEKSGITVDMTRTEHECDKSNIDRANQGNDSNYCIRIHADGSENSAASGISVLIPEKSYFGDDSFVRDSSILGQYILDSSVKNTGAKNKGLVTRSDLTGFNWSKVPVVLIECGFLTNPEERALLLTDEYQEKLAQGIADGFLKFVKEL
ncbi:MAG: N-acetylmuramoyl-L-alanine amidase [Clostridia bacterium]|nr:N-acetylmuramoyl-L-alanine amidase [Clostridia bacterium]